MILAQMVLCLVLPLQDWEYRQGAYVSSSGDRKTPEAFYQYGITLIKRGRTEEAIEVLRLIYRHGPGQELKERAHYKAGLAFESKKDFERAHKTYASFVARHPKSNLALQAKERAMYCALQFAMQGEDQTFFGLITVSTTSKPGIKLLRDFLKRYPREKFSAEYYLQLGRFLVKDEEFDEAIAEFTILKETYEKDYPAHAGQALIHLGEIHYHLFQGLDYDIKPLRESKRHFQEFLENKRFAALDPAWTRHAGEQIAKINELLAEKLYRVGEYYESRGYKKATRLYFETIVKEYPDTTWAKKVARRLGNGGK